MQAFTVKDFDDLVAILGADQVEHVTLEANIAGFVVSTATTPALIFTGWAGEVQS